MVLPLLWLLFRKASLSWLDQRCSQAVRWGWSRVFSRDEVVEETAAHTGRQTPLGERPRRGGQGFLAVRANACFALLQPTHLLRCVFQKVPATLRVSRHMHDATNAAATTSCAAA